MEQHTSQWGYLIVAANLVIAVVFIWFGTNLVRAARRFARRSSENRFRGRLGKWFLALGVFFTWIMLAWATILDFSEPLQATLLIICAGLGIRTLVSWLTASPDDGPA